MVALRGAVAILFGILASAWPGITVGVLVAFFGAYALVDGVFAIVEAFQGQDTDRWWHVAEGVLSVLSGLLLIVRPRDSAIALVVVIGIYAIIFGVSLIAFAFRLRGLHEHPGPSGQGQMAAV
jgi:uncharacterized membrane protein HdeD (DUF308 family)